MRSKLSEDLNDIRQALYFAVTTAPRQFSLTDMARAGEVHVNAIHRFMKNPNSVKIETVAAIHSGLVSLGIIKEHK